MNYDEKSVSTPDERLDAWMQQHPTLARVRARGRAVPRWLSGILVIGTFVVPLFWVMGDNTPFDWVFALIAELEGPRYAAAYFICVLGCLLPVLVFVQLFGARRIRQKEASSSSR